MISIIIPSKNRHNFLKRIIKYYSGIDEKFELIIVDSSKKKFHIKNKKSKIKLKIYHKPKLDPFDAMYYGAKKSTSEFVIYSGDDDFIMIKAAVKAANFLKKNKKFSAVLGKSLVFFIKNNSCYGEVVRCEEYVQNENKSNSQINRIETFFNKYNVNLFSVCRKNIFLKSLDIARIFKTNYSLKAEIVICFGIIFFGKLKKMNDYYLFRQNFTTHKRIQSLPSPGLIVKNNNFKNIIKKFELKISKYSSNHKKIKKILLNYLEKDLKIYTKQFSFYFKFVKFVYLILRKIKFIYKSKYSYNKIILKKEFLNKNKKLKELIYI